MQPSRQDGYCRSAARSTAQRHAIPLRIRNATDQTRKRLRASSLRQSLRTRFQPDLTCELAMESGNCLSMILPSPRAPVCLTPSYRA